LVQRKVSCQGVDKNPRGKEEDRREIARPPHRPAFLSTGGLDATHGGKPNCQPGKKKSLAPGAHLTTKT